MTHSSQHLCFLFAAAKSLCELLIYSLSFGVCFEVVECTNPLDFANWAF